MLKRSRGVTLIELIAGIVVLGISLAIITSVLGPILLKSADPWHQVRASELGQSLMNEIFGKAFDQQSSRSGSLLRCNETGAKPCTPAADFGPECRNGAPTELCAVDGKEQRQHYNDVDDFDGFITPGHLLSNILNEDLTDIYRGYQLSVQVRYAGGDFDLAPQQLKQIVVTVTTPTRDVIEFSAYKGNW